MTTLADIRAKVPELEGLDDNNAVQFLHEVYYPDFKIEDVQKRLGIVPPPPVVESPGKLRTIGDMGIKAAQGVIGLGESVVGLASLATGGYAGEGMRAIGYDPKATKEMLGEYLSPAQLEAEQNVSKATGFVDTLIELARNPRAIAGSIAESAPGLVGMGAVQMAAAKAIALKAAAPLGGLTTEAGAAAAKAAVENAAGRLMTYGSVTEGAQAAGSIADQAQAEGRSYGQYALPALAGGAGTAAIGRLAGKVMGDAETQLFTGAGGVKGGIAARTGKSLFSEGVLEEMPQSAQEQVWQNISQGKNWDEGVGAAAAAGLVSGGLMGAGMGAMQRSTAHPLEAAQASADASFQSIGTAKTVDQAITGLMGSVAPLVAPRETPEQTAEREAKNAKTMEAVRAPAENTLAQNLALQPEDDIPAGIVPGPAITSTPQAATPVDLTPVAAENRIAVAAAAQNLETAEKGPETAVSEQIPEVSSVSSVSSPLQPGSEVTGVAGVTPPVEGVYEAFDPAATIGVPRANMPQIKVGDRSAMVQFLQARGIDYQQEEVAASSLQPTQAEFSPFKVQEAREFTGGDRAILVSSDNRILDGHHQWLAKDPNEPVRVIRLNAPIETLLDATREFPSAELPTADDLGEVAPPAALEAPPTLTERAGAMSQRNRIREARKFNPETDTLLQALAKMGGVSRDLVAREYGMRPEELSHHVSIGNLKGYPFRKKGGMGLDQALTNLREAGYFMGVSDEDVARHFEDALFDEMGGKPTLTVQGQQRAAEEAYREASAEDEAMLDAELSAIEQAALSDDDVAELDAESNTSEEDFLIAMGMTPEEARAELQGLAQGRADEAGQDGAQETQQGDPSPPGAPPADAAQRPGLTLETQTEEGLREKTDREQAALAAEAAERAPAPPAPPSPADFELTGSDRPADRAGQGDLLSGVPNEENAPQPTSSESRPGESEPAPRGPATDPGPAAGQDEGRQAGQSPEPVQLQVAELTELRKRASVLRSLRKCLG